MSKLSYFRIKDAESFPPFPEDDFKTDADFASFPDDEKKGYNDLVALWLTECAILAYEHPQKVMDELALQGFTRVIFFNDSASQGFLACHPGYKDSKKSFAILAFRGTETEDYKNILTDVIVLKRPLDSLCTTDSSGSSECGMVHGGFLTALNNIWGTSLLDVDKSPKIKIEYIGTKGVGDAIQMIQKDNSRLYVTGHSLGGAMATLAAYRLKKNYPVNAMYTVGSPRVLSHGAVEIDSAPCPYYRIVNAQDLVPRVPLFGFQHVGQEVYLTTAGDKGDNPFREKFLKWLTLWGMIVMIVATMCGIEQKKCGTSPPVDPEHLLAQYFVAQNAFACDLGEKLGIPSFLIDNLVASSIMICFFLAPLWLVMAYRVNKSKESNSWMSLFKSQLLFWAITIFIVQIIDLKVLFPQFGGPLVDNVLFLVCLYILSLIIYKILKINEKTLNWFIDALVPNAFQDHSGKSYRKKLRQHCRPSASV